VAQPISAKLTGGVELLPIDQETLLALIGLIYDAALDSTLWPAALDAATRFVGADTGFLISEDAIAEKSFAHYQSREIPGFMESYYSLYVHLNPILVPTLVEARVGEVFTTSSFMTNQEFLESKFYTEWSGPFGFVDTIGAVLDKTSRSFTVISMLRNHQQGFADEAAIDRARLLVPHARRSLMIGRQVDLSRFESASFADTLDGLSAGVILVDPALRIHFANAQAKSMFDDGNLLREMDGAIVATSPASMAALRAAVSASAIGDAAAGMQNLSIALTGTSDRQYVAHVLPLTSGKRKKAGLGYDSVAAIFVKPLQNEEPSPLQLLADMYGLTSREMSVMLAIVETGGVPDVAKVLGISQETVKSNLKRIFAKTSTGRQADLARIVAGVANPFSTPKTP
jgi:DNA-binding NarL/FixJ family response regulator